MSFTLGGQQIGFLRLHFPEHGVHSAEVELQSATLLTGQQTLVAGDLTLTGVVTGGLVAGRGRYEWTAGAGRWGEVIAAIGYDASVGVRIGRVLQDAASLCGETLTLGVPDVHLGIAPHAGMGRASGPAWDVFRALAVPWYLDAAGVTQVTARPAGEAPMDGVVTRWDREHGYRAITPASERLAGYLPGRTFEGEEIVTLDVEARENAPIRLMVYTRTPAGSSDPLGALNGLIDRRTAGARYYGRYRYKVVKRAGTLYDLDPVDSALGLSRLSGRDIFSGAAGHDAILPEDYIVAVSFLDGLESRPMIDGFMRATADNSTLPFALSFNATNRINLGTHARPVATKNDTTTGPVIGIANGVGTVIITITNPDNSSLVSTLAVPPGGGAISVVNAPPFPGSITTKTVIDTPAQTKVFA